MIVIKSAENHVRTRSEIDYLLNPPHCAILEDRNPHREGTKSIGFKMIGIPDQIQTGLVMDFVDLDADIGTGRTGSIRIGWAGGRTTTMASVSEAISQNPIALYASIAINYEMSTGVIISRVDIL